MKCIFCNSMDTRVVDSRSHDDGMAIRRRRECLECFRRFTTFEKAEPVRLMVIKKDGAKQLFDLAKIRKGVEKACEKRPVSGEAIDEMMERIRQNAYDLYEDDIPASDIGKMVLNELKRVDEVAYARFSIVYHEISDLESFYRELKRIIHKDMEGKAD